MTHSFNRLIQIKNIPNKNMKSYLTVNDLRVLDLVNSQGACTRTPEGSEVDELESMYLLGDCVFWAGKHNLITNKIYDEWVRCLDNIPTVGEYVSALAMN